MGKNKFEIIFFSPPKHVENFEKPRKNNNEQ